MNARWLMGALVGAAVGIGSIPLWMSHLKAYVNADANLGTVACKADYNTAIRAGVPYGYGSIRPRCEGNFPQMRVAGFTLVPQSQAKKGDDLVCSLVRHNDWYFVWDSRGHGFYNDATYSFNNCFVGRMA